MAQAKMAKKREKRRHQRLKHRNIMAYQRQ